MGAVVEAARVEVVMWEGAADLEKGKLSRLLTTNAGAAAVVSGADTRSSVWFIVPLPSSILLSTPSLHASSKTRRLQQH
jgi:hypothetical protein